MEALTPKLLQAYKKQRTTKCFIKTEVIEEEEKSRKEEQKSPKEEPQTMIETERQTILKTVYTKFQDFTRVHMPIELPFVSLDGYRLMPCFGLAKIGEFWQLLDSPWEEPSDVIVPITVDEEVERIAKWFQRRICCPYGHLYEEHEANEHQSCVKMEYHQDNWTRVNTVKEHAQTMFLEYKTHVEAECTMHVAVQVLPLVQNDYFIQSIFGSTPGEWFNMQNKYVTRSFQKARGNY